jgi:protein-cysteine N-palmitoyltransferase HHAT
MVIQQLRQLYSLDTLDTRFVVPATAPPKEALELAELDPASPLPVRNGLAKGKQNAEGVRPPRWSTIEFYLWYLIVGMAVPLMFWSVLTVSRGPSLH